MMFAIVLVAHAQWIRTSGSFGASADVYRSYGASSRLPSETYRVVGRITVTLFDQIDVPFELFLNSGQLGYQQPFNQFGVTPRISNWLQLFGGWYTMRISDFTFGDLRVLGGGFELSPGSFRLAFHYGYTRQARNPDTAFAFWGEYRRRIAMGKIGYESMSGDHFTLQVMSSQDEPGTIRRDSLTSPPQSNMVVSLSAGIGMFDNAVRLRGEIAVGAFTNNIEIGQDSALAASIPTLVQQAIPTNASSNIDGAARVSLSLAPSADWGISLDGQWIGPGFVTLGYAQLLNDLLDLSASPYLRLAGGNVYVRATIGRRANNLRQTRIATVERWTSNVNLGWQVTNAVGVDLQYGRYSMLSNHTNDTLRMDNVMNQVTLSPRAQFKAWGVDNSAVLSLSWQQTTDNNIVTGVYGSNRALVLSATHSVTLPSQVSLSTSISHNRVENYAQNLAMTTLNEAVTYPLIERTLNLNGSLGFNITAAQATTIQLLLRAALTYTLEKAGSFTVQIMNNSFDLTQQQGRAYNELFGSVQYSVSF